VGPDCPSALVPVAVRVGQYHRDAAVHAQGGARKERNQGEDHGKTGTEKSKKSKHRLSTKIFYFLFFFLYKKGEFANQQKQKIDFFFFSPIIILSFVCRVCVPWPHIFHISTEVVLSYSTNGMMHEIILRNTTAAWSGRMSLPFAAALSRKVFMTLACLHG
jgi:hypothetical protein